MGSMLADVDGTGLSRGRSQLTLKDTLKGRWPL